MEELQKQINALKGQVDELTKKMEDLSQPNTIPIEVENAFIGRNFVEMELIEDPIGQYGSQTLNNDRNIDTVFTPDFTILEYPLYWGKIKNGREPALFIPLYINPDVF